VRHPCDQRPEAKFRLTGIVVLYHLPAPSEFVWVKNQPLGPLGPKLLMCFLGVDGNGRTKRSDLKNIGNQERIFSKSVSRGQTAF
jgi:hypothetical protein